MGNEIIGAQRLWGCRKLDTTAFRSTAFFTRKASYHRDYPTAKIFNASNYTRAQKAVHKMGGHLKASKFQSKCEAQRDPIQFGRMQFNSLIQMYFTIVGWKDLP